MMKTWNDPELVLEAAWAATVPQTVLILDDDSEVATWVSRLAHREGFETVKASTHDEAAGHLSDWMEPRSLRMVILDAELGPEFGADTYDLIRRQNPTVPVVFLSSGPVQKVLIPIIARDPWASFLPRPCSDEDIRDVIRDPLLWGGDVGRLVVPELFR